MRLQFNRSSANQLHSRLKAADSMKGRRNCGRPPLARPCYTLTAPRRKPASLKSVHNLIQTKFREVFEQLRNNISDVQALILVGPDGVLDHVLDDPSLNIETFAIEYATLLRIARSASEDSGAGDLLENIVVSEKSVMVARSISHDHYLILFSRSHQIGRARYELKQVTWTMQQP